MMTKTTSYIVTAPKTPGARPSAHPAKTLAEARKIAKTFGARRDLAGQDVRIEKADGSLVEYAGPAR